MSSNSIRWAFNFTAWAPTEQELLLATRCIQAEEKDRINKYLFKNDFKGSLIGRLLMRKFIFNFAEIPYEMIRFDRDDKGKPILRNTNDTILSFNVSHNGDYAVLAGEIDRKHLGCDVMKFDYRNIDKLDNYFRLMHRTFSNYEWEFIRKNRDDKRKQIENYFRIWSLKESYVKALGVGISTNLQDISFDIKSPEIKQGVICTDTRLYVKDKLMNWSFEETCLGDKDNYHVVAVALNNEDGAYTQPSAFVELSFSELMKDAVPILGSDVEYCKNYYQKLEK